MTTRKRIAVFAMVASLILGTGMAAAQTNTQGAVVDGSATNQGDFDNSQSGSVSTDGGNITYANLSSKQSTTSWTGVFGNATGTITLGDGTSQLYSWDAVAEYVFFSTDTSVSFANLASQTTTTINSELGLGDSNDNATQTFNDGTTNLNDYGVTGAATALTYDEAGNPVWKTVALDDGDDTSQNVFAGVAQPNGAEKSYAGTTADYQVILPETDDGSATSFSVYMELQ